jgi:hypothetical protein
MSKARQIALVLVLALIGALVGNYVLPNNKADHGRPKVSKVEVSSPLPMPEAIPGAVVVDATAAAEPPQEVTAPAKKTTKRVVRRNGSETKSAPVAKVEQVVTRKSAMAESARREVLAQKQRAEAQKINQTVAKNAASQKKEVANATPNRIFDGS